MARDVLQVVILRDGLLVGTEVFLPGEVTVGAGCDLALDGVAPHHARLTLREGRVTVQAERGSVFINGHPVGASAARPVDDVAIGPYALKLRVVGPKKSAPQRLFLELFWGEQRLESRSFARLPADQPLRGGHDDRAAMPLWGFAVDGPLAVEHGGGYRVFVPRGAAVERRDARGDFQPVPAARHVDVALGEAVRFTSEQTALVAFVGVPQGVPRGRGGRDLSFFAVTAALMAVFGAFASLAPTEDEAEFVLEALPRPDVRLAVFERPRPPAQTAEPSRRPPHRSVKGPRAKHVLPFGGQAIAQLVAAKLPDMKFGPPGKRVAGNRNPVIDVPGPKGAPTLGFGASGTTRGIGTYQGIGAMAVGKVGAFGVAGQVDATGRKPPAPLGEGIDKNAVRKVVDAHVHVISSCYERAMIAEKDASGGKVTLEWGISTDGRVTHVRTKHSSMKTSAVERCIMQALKTWEFPKAKRAGVLVTYPFLFNSVGYP